MVESIYSPDLVRINIADKTEDDPCFSPASFAETLELFNLPDDISCQFVLNQAAHDLVLITCLLAGATQVSMTLVEECCIMLCRCSGLRFQMVFHDV